MTTTKVITGKVRFSYAHVHEPKAIQEGQKEKYSVSILIPKTDKATIGRINQAVETAKQECKGKWNGKIPAVLKLPLRDGDAERPDDEAYEGCMFLNANAVNKPGIVGPDGEELMSKEEFYSGCFGRASVNFYGYSAGGNKGVACGLNNLQKLEDGDRLSGDRSTAAEDFGSDDDLLG